MPTKTIEGKRVSLLHCNIKQTDEKYNPNVVLYFLAPDGL